MELCAPAVHHGSSTASTASASKTPRRHIYAAFTDTKQRAPHAAHTRPDSSSDTLRMRKKPPNPRLAFRPPQNRIWFHFHSDVLPRVGCPRRQGFTQQVNTSHK
ncbi:uncharacterized protein V6R79_015798 [Siganus canaliculatus]